MRPEYDGVAEVWFESEEELMQGMSSAAGQKLGAALLEDEGTISITQNRRHSLLKSVSFSRLTNAGNRAKLRAHIAAKTSPPDQSE